MTQPTGPAYNETSNTAPSQLPFPNMKYVGIRDGKHVYEPKTATPFVDAYSVYALKINRLLPKGSGVAMARVLLVGGGSQDCIGSLEIPVGTDPAVMQRILSLMQQCDELSVRTIGTVRTTIRSAVDQRHNPSAYEELSRILSGHDLSKILRDKQVRGLIEFGLDHFSNMPKSFVDKSAPARIQFATYDVRDSLIKTLGKSVDNIPIQPVGFGDVQPEIYQDYDAERLSNIMALVAVYLKNGGWKAAWGEIE